MTARAEIEEILEQEVWRQRVESCLCGRNTMLDEALHPVPAAERLAAYERDNYRDCPAADAYDDMPVVGGAVAFAVGLLAVAGVAAIIWLFNH